MQVRAARGAITVERDERDEVVAATARLLARMLADNGIAPGDVVSVIFTATDDLRSAFPAAAARAVGLNEAPLLCARELDVEDSLARVVRVLLHFLSERSPSEVVHVYLEGAAVLRDGRD